MRKFLFLLLFSGLSAAGFGQVHTTYLWHLQQPIYWPEQSEAQPAQYQQAWESHELKTNGGNIYPDGKAHPLNDLAEIFGKDDRKAVYQWRTKDAVQSLLGLPDAGAQVNYSGCLIENVRSLADAGQWGYSPGWQDNFQTARGWQTSGGHPRMDIVGFTFHHVIAPLVSERVLAKEIQTHRYIYQQTFGSNPDYSQGFWPAECSFSERIIKVLAQEGIQWSVIANSHLARTLADYPLSFGTAGCNMEPPNAADRVSTLGTNWWSGQIDGRGGTFAAPYCYQAHKAQYVDPESGEVYAITVVPMDDVLSYMNGYALMGTGEIDTHIAPFDNPDKPSIVLLAHDGDNAWGGGYDYYNNSVPQFAQAAANKGYVPSTIQQFLSDNPVAENEVVRVEDGSWVNAANDWGHPQFINWLWPMYTQDYQFNPEGWTEDARNWAVLVAAENYVIMAEDLEGTPPVADVVEPTDTSSVVAKAWHHLLPGYTSGYMYYGSALDMEVKQSLAANIAIDYANQVIAANPGVDDTPPSVFIPQRYPYNPGGIGFGPTYGYQQHQNSNDFTVWTFAYDVSGLDNVILKYRLDEDGTNPLDDNANELYAGGQGVGSWQSLSMDNRLFPAENVGNNPDIVFFIMPDHIAYQYWAEISGITESLVDYYVEATDTHGNIFKTPIQHVYVGEASSAGTGDVTWTPENPDNEDLINIVVNNATQAGNLHWGINGFEQPIEDYWPVGSFLVNGILESPFFGPNAEDQLTLQIGPFNNPDQDVNTLNFVIHYADDSWDNNNGQNYTINIGPGGSDIIQWLPSQPAANETITITVNQAGVSGKLHWGVNGWNEPDESYWPEDTYLFGGSGPAVQSPMDGPNANDQLIIQIGSFSNPAQAIETIDFVVSFDDGSWNNNNGQDYHINILPAQEAGTLSGAVIHVGSGQYLTNAIVTISNGVQSYATTSAEEISTGINYIIENIPPGIYELSCEKNGFESQTLTNVEIIDGQTTTVDFDMEAITYSLPPGWDYQLTPVSHHLALPEGLIPTFNDQPVDYGDFIGVFYMNDAGEKACGGALQFDYENTVLTAFGNDNFTPEKDGFITGENLQWYLYRQEAAQEFQAEVSYNPNYPQFDGLFYPNGLSQILSFQATTFITQNIIVKQGWSGISAFLNPNETNLETLFAPFQDDFVILTSTSGIYYPETGINTIQDWDAHSGYKIKSLNSFNLTLEGSAISPPIVNLDSGWNLIPVSTPCGAAPEGVAGQVGGLNIIKGIATVEVYWPEYGIQSLAHLEAGAAYWLSTSQAGSFTFPECELSYKSKAAGIINSTPWNEVLHTDASHLIAIPAEVLGQGGILAGDVLGVFTPDGRCAGTTSVDNISQNQVLIAFANDQTTVAQDGFNESEIMILKMYRPEGAIEALLDLTWESDKPQEQFFAANGISAAESLAINSSGSPQNQIEETGIYPNPGSGIFTIDTRKMEGAMDVTITDIQGDIVFSEVMVASLQGLTVDLSGKTEGIYIIKITSKASTFAGKILLIKK